MLDFKNVKLEYDKILEQLSDPELISNWEEFEKLAKRKTFFEKIIEKEKEVDDFKNRIEENKQILKSNEDPGLSSLAETETVELSEKLQNTEEELKRMLSEDDKPSEESAGPKAVIVEIRAGTGGEEASLFAADLFRMYSKYCQIKAWQQKILDSSPSGVGGFKEIVFEMKNGNIWPSIKYEAGVHRVQRIPTTEKSGRVHTSTASVAVLPKPRKGKIAINPHDLKIDTYKASGPGGQYVNKRMTAVRVTHLPTGLVVTSQIARNLQQNRENAISILEAKILEKKESEESAKMGKERRLQIGKAKRAEKIRTYNFPQNRVTDHRIQKSFHNIEEIMEGKLDSIISSLQELKD